MERTLIEVKNLKKYFTINSNILKKDIGEVKAVDGVNFLIKEGETLGLVGESGCGKSTLGRLILNLTNPSEGEVKYNGENIFDLKKRQMNKLRKEMQIIFQDPFSSLNPRMNIKNIVSEGAKIHKIYSKDEIDLKIEEIINKCGLLKEHLTRFPHQFSGGQRQRIGIARALALNPKFIVCDESVSALDVSIQAKIINLLKDLQNEFNLTYLFISHDLSVVKFISDRIGVMYFGRIVELAEKDKLFDNPIHPYTKKLLSAIPITHPSERFRKSEKTYNEIELNFPVGYLLDDRKPKDRYNESKLIEVSKGHYIACYKPE